MILSKAQLVEIIILIKEGLYKFISDEIEVKLFGRVKRKSVEEIIASYCDAKRRK